MDERHDTMSSSTSNRNDIISNDNGDEWNASPELEEHLTAAADEAVDKADRLSRKAVEFRRESARLRAESRKVLERAEQLDKKAKGLDADSKTSRSLGNTLRYQTMLQRLSRNDKSLVDVASTEDLDFPDGYGKTLGEALRDNKVVTKLELNLSTILSSQCRARLEYHGSPTASTCTSKQKNLEALVSGELEPALLHFLKTSTSLQNVAVCYPKRSLDRAACSTIGNLLLNALTESKSLRELKWTDRLPSFGICTLLRASRSLRSLTFSLNDTAAYSVDHRQSIASAIGSSKTLESFTLQVPKQEEALAIEIFGKLHRVRSLRELCLGALEDFDDSYYVALSQYLRAANRTLQKFHMEFFFLDDSIMDTVLSGLVHRSHDSGNNSHAYVTISKLFFSECEWHYDAVERLVGFLQTIITNAGGETVYDSKLRELCIMSDPILGHFVSRHLAASLLAAPPNASMKLVPTIGSQLETLTLDNVQPLFLEQLGDNAHRVQLQNLHLWGISKQASVAFARSLPKLKSIRKLKLANVATGTTRRILHGLKHNGSVRQVFANSGDGDEESCFSDKQLRLMEAYCKRNRLLGALLQIGRVSASATNGASLARILPKYPMLLQVAQQVPDTREAKLLQGLLSIGQCRLGHESPPPTRTSRRRRRQN